MRTALVLDALKQAVLARGLGSQVGVAGLARQPDAGRNTHGSRSRSGSAPQASAASAG